MLVLPNDYKPLLDIKNTQVAIKQVKDCFQKTLAKKMNLVRVSAPLFVLPSSGINDNLNGVERPVSFEISGIKDENAEIVHSLAKWKRMALKKYDFNHGEGIYTDMNAIRRDEELDNLHSVYVDQWDWEKVITKEERTVETLYSNVKTIFDSFKIVESYITDLYPSLKKYLPEEVFFISSQELEDMYPQLSPKERENKICEKYKAVFLTQIGCKLKSGERHDGRAPDYDDWSLNGDLLFWYPVLNQAFEVSSMGIRVDEDSLVKQLDEAGCPERKNFKFHKDIIDKNLPYTIGGGLGQSRICMYFLSKAHIGEVQVSLWPDDMAEKCSKSNIQLL